MEMALELALRAQGRTHPNPMVGAVVVKGGRVIATGYHKRAGIAHAEVVALKKAGSRARGADFMSRWSYAVVMERQGLAWKRFWKAAFGAWQRACETPIRSLAARDCASLKSMALGRNRAFSRRTVVL